MITSPVGQKPLLLAETVARAFIHSWISCFGVPSTVTTDRGHQFESALWNQLMHLLGCKRIQTTSYHPAANGLIKRFHCQLKTSLTSHPNPHLKDDLRCMVAELVYGTTLCLPGEFFDESKAEATPDPVCYVTRLKTMMRDLQATPVHKQTPTNTHVSPTLKSCIRVFVRHDNPYRSPMTDRTKYRSVQRNITLLTLMDMTK